jgi:hypothetical protein
LANICSTWSSIPDGVFYEIITQRSIKVKTSAPPETSATDPGATLQEDAEDITDGSKQQVLLLEPLWTEPFLAYLMEQRLPDDPTEARHIVR